MDALAALVPGPSGRRPCGGGRQRSHASASRGPGPHGPVGFCSPWVPGFVRACPRTRFTRPGHAECTPRGHDERQTEVLCGRSHNDVGTIGLSFPQAIGAHSRRRVS